jgi:hypothetical protein
MGRLIFLTFGAPYYIYSDAIKRIIKQAQEFNIFDEIIQENEVKLIDKHVDFWNKHGNFIKNNSRGFGYWLWKPYLINETLKKMNEDDILLYCDVGCELNKNGIENFNKLIEIVKIKKIIGFSAGSCDISHTKRDLSYQYNFNIRLLLVNHLQAGCLLIQKCKFIDMIIDEWYRTCEIYHNIDDSQSKILNFKNFMDHRHDQSVLNMILKKYKIINNFDGDYLSSNKNMITSPILYIRNKTGKSVL